MVLADIEGVRSLLAVPLVSGGKGIGAIVLYRREVAPFTDDDLALVQGFAAQAVIAVQNVRISSANSRPGWSGRRRPRESWRSSAKAVMTNSRYSMSF